MTPSDGSVDPTLTPSQLETNKAATSDTVVATGTDAGVGVPNRGSRLSVAGYEIGDVIGKGGMGEVLLAHDPKIGRNVAIKRMRSSDASGDAVERFLREAKIQGRLDHPAIVPVHELGKDSEGRPYFTMKRLAGTTLQDVLDTTPQQKLLRAFIDVCLAIEFAHARGVVHRDLKPSNIMLGDYGEVYVLDWGIARVVGDREGEAGEPGDITTLEGNTQVGAMLGTPGYMAPEQVRGDENIGPPADVYALGSLLFEILAGAPLHPRGHAAIASTLAAEAPAPASRHPDRTIAPELDAACVAAIVADPSVRPSARELAERVQRYLDGDRDVEQRRALAATQLELARVALAEPERRAEAVRLAGHALVLDPQSKEAAALVMTMMIEPPRVLPRPLQDQLREHDVDLGVKAARTAGWAMLAYLSFVPILLWSGGVRWSLFAAGYAIVLVIAGQTFYQAHIRKPNAMMPLLLNGVLMVIFSRLIGPFVIVPGIIGMMTASLIAQPELVNRPLLVMGVGLTAMFAPVILEAVGVFGETWRVTEGAVVMSSRAMHIGGAPTIVFLLASNFAIVLINGLFGRTVAASRRDAQQRVEIQAWHLKQLLPVEPPTPRIVTTC
jgi:serine/threonine protein kinase